MRSILITAVAVAALASSSHAQERSAAVDGQAAVARLAVMAADSIMGRGDLDRNGSLDAAELRVIGRMMGRSGGLDGKGWASADADRNGSVSRRELIEAFRAEIPRAAVAGRGMRAGGGR